MVGSVALASGQSASLTQGTIAAMVTVATAGSVRGTVTTSAVLEASTSGSVGLQQLPA